MRSVRTMAWTVALVVLMVCIPLMPFMIIALLWMTSMTPGCEQRKELAQATSPDGAWVATVYYNVCSDGAFVTTVDDTVEITRPGEQPSPVPSAGTVFGMEDRPYGVKTPLAVRWTASRNLEVTIPNGAWPGRQDPTFADVAISYKYVPDDPIERECLKQWRALPTDEMVRRSQSSTENIKVFLGKCRSGQ